MSNDEKAIRNVIDTWLAASKAGDLDTVLRLMADDVLFLVAGRKPFGKVEFAASFHGMKGIAMEGSSEVQEIEVAGEWAWCRTELRVSVTPPGGAAIRRAGPVLTIFRKRADGAWVIARDANLLAAEPMGT
jgi:uncharacterized protein (TIGR02246 family)